MTETDKNVTDLVHFDINDDECLPITKCLCGAEFKPWDFVISIYRDSACKCPKCGRDFYFKNSIQVYQRGD